MWESNAKIYRLVHFFNFSLKYTFIFISINKHAANKRIFSFPKQKYFWLKKKPSVCFLFYAEKEIENKERFVVTLILLWW